MNIFQNIIMYIAAFFLAIVPMTEYKEGVLGQPQSFLPSQARTQTDKTISKLIYRGLFKYDIYGVLVPDLADTWEVSEDNLIYTVKLKNNQYWSDGRKITSDDLIYTAFKVPDLSGVGTDKVDELTVRYILPNKFSPFLNMLTVGVMPMDAEEKMNPLRPVSNGAFRVIQVERNGPAIQSVVLLQEGKNPSIRRLKFRFYVNEEELLLGAKLGEIDGFLYSTEQKLDNFSEHIFPAQGIYYALFFNLRNEQLAELELRQKLAQTLPVDTLIEHLGISVEGVISRNDFTDKALDFDNYRKNFVPEANDINLQITVPNIETHIALAEKIKLIWEQKLGANITIDRVDPEDFYEDVIKDRNFEVLLYGQEVGRDPDRYISWHSTQKDDPGLNLTGFEHVRADRALEEGRNEVDPEKRKVHYNEFQKAVNEQLPAVFLYHPYYKYYVSKYIEGIGEKYTFSVGDRFLDFSNWKVIQTN